MVEEYPIEELQDFHEVIFKPYGGKRMDEMIESIGEYGIITPIIIRELGDRYEILSGHNRVRAAKAVGCVTVPALNKGDINDDEAKFIVTESNIVQRGFMELSLLERAHCIAVRHDAMKQQGYRSDLVRQIEEGNYESDDASDESVATNRLLADSFDLSPRSVNRYVKIHSLTDALKVLVDHGCFGMTAGEELSFLLDKHQIMTAEVANEHEEKITYQDAVALRDLEESNRFTKENVVSILVKNKSVKVMRISLSKELVERYFDDYEEDEVHDVLEKALELWFATHPMKG